MNVVHVVNSRVSLNEVDVVGPEPIHDSILVATVIKGVLEGALAPRARGGDEPLGVLAS